MSDEVKSAEQAAKEAEFRKHWPAWFYGPDGAKQVFDHPDEVPEGWADHPAKVGDEPDDGPSALDRLREKFGDKSKTEIKDALKEIGVEFDGRSSAEDLAKLLLDSFDADDDSSDDN